MRLIIFILIAFQLTSFFPFAQSTSAQKPTIKPEAIASGVKIDSILSTQQTENLFVLARTWGFLKYFHPQVARGDYNFDSCLFAILPSVLRAEDKKQRDKLLLNWINKLGDENRFPVVS